MSEWHGLQLADWVRLWDQMNWRAHVHRALLSIATSRAAKPKHRIIALQTLNEAITRKALPHDPQFPKLMGLVMLDITTGGEPSILGRVFVRIFRRRLQARLRAQLIGARQMLQTAYQFLDEAEVTARVPESFS
jgi:hypothetical protein